MSLVPETGDAVLYSAGAPGPAMTTGVCGAERPVMAAGSSATSPVLAAVEIAMAAPAAPRVIGIAAVPRTCGRVSGNASVTVAANAGPGPRSVMPVMARYSARPGS